MAVVRFDCFELDAAAGQLRRRGRKLRLRDQPLQVLAMLLGRAGEVVTREDLQGLLWPNDVDVDFENNLNTAIGRLREVLGDSAKHPRFIETLPRRGYRFIGKVLAGAQAPPKVRVIVLPFVNSSGDPSEEYFSDAMTGEIIAELSSVTMGRIAVIARATSMHYKGTLQDVASIARDLSVAYVVEGSTRRNGRSVALTVELTRTADQTEIFAKRWEVDSEGIFDLQGTAARALGEQVLAAAGEGTGHSVADVPRRRNPTSDLDAYNSFILGRHHIEMGDSPPDWKIARESMEQAVARDPEFALAYDGLAEVWWRAGFVGAIRPKEALARGLPNALRALEIDDGAAEAHAMFAQYRKQIAYDWAEVTREMNLAVELNPYSPIVRTRRAVSLLMPLGRIEEAIDDCERALAVDPLSATSRFWLCEMLALARFGPSAVEQGLLAIRIAPNNLLGYLALSQAYLVAESPEKSVEAQRNAVELAHGAPAMQGWLGLVLGLTGGETEARRILESLRATSEKAFVPASSFAWIHLALGEIDAFFVWMDRAIDERDHMIMPIKLYPFMDRARKDPRFAQLLRRMNLHEPSAGTDAVPLSHDRVLESRT